MWHLKRDACNFIPPKIRKCTHLVPSLQRQAVQLHHWSVEDLNLLWRPTIAKHKKNNFTWSWGDLIFYWRVPFFIFYLIFPNWVWVSCSQLTAYKHRVYISSTFYAKTGNTCFDPVCFYHNFLTCFFSSEIKILMVKANFYWAVQQDVA